MLQVRKVPFNRVPCGCRLATVEPNARPRPLLRLRVHARAAHEHDLRHGLATLRDFPRILESGSLEERKEFVRAFVGDVTVTPGEERLELQTRGFQATALPHPANFTCGMVAGARFERVQIEMRPAGRVVARRKPIRLVA